MPETKFIHKGNGKYIEHIKTKRGAWLDGGYRQAFCPHPAKQSPVIYVTSRRDIYYSRLLSSNSSHLTLACVLEFDAPRKITDVILLLESMASCGDTHPLEIYSAHSRLELNRSQVIKVFECSLEASKRLDLLVQKEISTYIFPFTGDDN